ncbi:hypothetical protein F400_gp101 [Bacillus phage BCD7]|uniref:Uncharacterized protein n=1 Tax=Bacillus phage BCD7 TaxID=1136534 RepID=J9PTZ8_9CAUD|nr:hypothetical protein F400_gp101 [Bacillus phage BCD7]AEZ50548.1 hypothetical protein BCD7_0101 [Bacillus phage BCD7]
MTTTMLNKFRPQKLTIKTFLEGMFMTVHAEEPTTPPATPPTGGTQTPPANPNTPPAPSGTVNYEELIANARKEEKAKLYPEIEKLKQDKNNYVLVVGERDKTIAELTAENEKLKAENATLKEGAKSGKASTVQNAELSAQVTTLQQQVADWEAKYNTDVAQIKADSYRKEKIAGANGAIIPELVTGNTPEEIDASFETAKARYAEIANQAVGNVHIPPANPSAQMLQGQFQQVTAQDVSKMTPAEYAEWRKVSGLFKN